MKSSILFFIVLLVSINIFSAELTPKEVVEDFADAIIEYDMERFVYHFSDSTVSMFVGMFELFYQLEDDEEFEALIGMSVEEFINKGDREMIVIILENVDELKDEFQGVEDIEIISENIDGDDAIVFILVEEEEEEIPLVLENNEWKIDLTSFL